jgi:hypothetical protein
LRSMPERTCTQSMVSQFTLCAGMALLRGL